MSRVLATSSKQFQHIKKDSNTTVVCCISWVIRQNVIRQLATSAENLVASPQFLVALATGESQFQALDQKAGKEFESNFGNKGTQANF